MTAFPSWDAFRSHHDSVGSCSKIAGFGMQKGIHQDVSRFLMHKLFFFTTRFGDITKGNETLLKSPSDSDILFLEFVINKVL
jgi:hypothetical protein